MELGMCLKMRLGVGVGIGLVPEMTYCKAESPWGAAWYGVTWRGAMAWRQQGPGVAPGPRLKLGQGPGLKLG